MRDRFFETLNYASVNEDWRTEAQALRPGTTDRILCVTGSGDRPLNLLAVTGGGVLAIDVNPAQTDLLRLKIAALRRLSFDDYAAFLGLRAADGRWRRDRLAELSPDLPPDTRRFWSARPAMITTGVLYAGRWERFHRRVADLLRRLPFFSIHAVFECDDLAEQRRFLDRRWSPRFWRWLASLLCSPLLSPLCFGDPAYVRNGRFPAGRYVSERMRRALHRGLARESFMMSLLLRGTLTPFDLPPHLTPEGAAVVRSRLDRLEIVTGDLLEVLDRAPAGSFTHFSLSDVPSFLDAAGFRRLLRGIAASAAPGARFCIRQFLRRHVWPDGRTNRLHRERSLEKQLAVWDRAFAYDFLVGVVDPD
ncbi:MAG: DUF3419 family protein [Thermoanaerobaculia bacterium]